MMVSWFSHQGADHIQCNTKLSMRLILEVYFKLTKVTSLHDTHAHYIMLLKLNTKYTRYFQFLEYR